jgi:uncharacterized protein (TIGR03067 family)
MRRIVCLLAGVLLVVPVLGSDSPKEYGDATEIDGIEGTWRFVSAERIGGDVKRVEWAGPPILTFRGGRYVGLRDGRTVEQGDYWVDNRQTPRHFDRFPESGPNRGFTLPYIYRVDGNTLKIAQKSDNLERPTGFTQGDVIILSWQRVK